MTVDRVAVEPSVEFEQLPVLPAVVVRIMGLSPGSEQFFEEVLLIASEDPSLAAARHQGRELAALGASFTD